MTELDVFKLVFIGQIILLSAYYPSRVLQRASRLRNDYPASEFPRLYPKGMAFFNRSMRFYQLVNGFNFVLGWVLLYFIHSGDLLSDGRVNPLLPWGYFMIQMIPSQFLEFYGFKLAKLMKQQDQRTTRSAQLTPRRWQDYVSPGLMGLVILSYLGFVSLAFYLDDFTISTDSAGFLMSVILLLGFGVFFALSAWMIYGKKADPYQTSEDRHRSVGLVIRTFCFTLIACTIFMALTLTFETSGLKAIMPILMSVFLQCLVFISMGYMLNNLRLEDINFDVYRASNNH